MLDNLDYEAENSKGLTLEQRDRYKEFNLHGRYYHFVNVDSVCPAGWRLPIVEDWSRYFEYLTTDVHPGVTMENVVVEKPSYHTAWVNFEGKLDIFEKGNPLNLYPTGRFEGNEFNRPDVYADYYTTDDHESFEGKTHIHLMNAWITIHSHKHNMQPRKEKELRRFQVRCVQ